MRSGELEKRIKDKTIYLEPSLNLGKSANFEEAAFRHTADRIGSPQRRFRDSNIDLIFQKVSKLKDEVRLLADQVKAKSENDSFANYTRLADKNSLHLYVEREREAIRLMNSRNDLAAGSSQGKLRLMK